MATQVTLDGTSPAGSKASRKSYTREYKLSVVEVYRSSTLYATAKRFGLNTKTILRWAADEEKIRQSSKGSKHAKHCRKADYADMEAVLFDDYKELRKKGLKVKAFWFRTRAIQLMEQMHPEVTFHFSAGWFDRFKTRHSISLRRPTNVCQTPADDKVGAIRSFHERIRSVAALPEGGEVKDVGKFTLSQIANMDQTPLPFTFTDGGTYADKGEKSVWVRGGASGMDKRQCTVQLTIFASAKREPRVKPLLIFRGKGVRIPLREKVSTSENNS